MKNELRDENEIKRDKRINAMRLGRRAALLFAIAFLIGCVYLFRGNIAEWYARLRSAKQLETMQETTAYSRIKFEPDDGNIFALYGTNLVVLNRGTFKVYTPSGSELFTLNVGLSNPALELCESYAVIYDRGGRDIMLADSSALLASLKTEGNIIGLSVSEGGYIVTVEEDELYRASVNVYNTSQKPVYQWKTSDYYVMNAALSPDGRTLMVTGYTQSEGEFLSRLIFFDLNEQQYRATADLAGTLALNAHFISDSSAVVTGDDAAFIYSIDGERLSLYEYGNDTLKTGAVGEDYNVVSLTDRTTGLGAKLVCLDAAATAPASVLTSDEVRQMAVCGDYIAVLYTQSIQLFNRNLEKLSDEVSVSQVKDILVNDTGLVMLIYGSDAGYIDLLSAFSGQVKEGDGE